MGLSLLLHQNQGGGCFTHKGTQDKTQNKGLCPAHAHHLQDVLRVKREGGSLQQPVSHAMASPVVTIPITASVQDAAYLMMDERVRPLPVVDPQGKLLG